MMAINFSISDSGKYLICRVTEPLTADVVHQMIVGLNRLENQTGIYRRLVDVRGMPNMLSVAGNYDLAYKDMEAMQIDRSTKLATLELPSDNTHEFVNTAIQNAGFNMKIFTDEAAAVAWLESDE